MTDLDVLVQQFGHATRNFSLQAVAILIAEPKWFYNEHERKQMHKCKWQQKLTSTCNQCSAPNMVIEMEENHSKSDEELLHGMRGDHEGTEAVDQDVVSCIHMIAVDRKGRSVVESVQFFINAWWLHGSRCCRRFHTNEFYKNNNISECPLILFMSSADTHL
jgi:hypothetical protein